MVSARRDRTTQRGRYSNFLHAVAHIRLGTAQLSGLKLERRWLAAAFWIVEGPRTPYEALVW